MNTIFLVTILAFLLFYIGRRWLIILNPNVKNVSAEEAYTLINEHKELIILDVRTKEEYDRGHIPGAMLFPVQELSDRMNELTIYKNKPVLVHCASGGRSPQAVKILLHHKFLSVYHLYSGLLTWKHPLQIS